MNVEQTAMNAIPAVKVGNQLLLSNRSQNSLILLNSSATLIWQKYSTGASINQIIELLQTKYQIDYEQAVSDISSLLDSCRKANLFNQTRLPKDTIRWSTTPKHNSLNKLTDDLIVREEFYQLNKLIFKIEYCQDKLFRLIHPVFEHLSIKQYSINNKKRIRYQISYNSNYCLESSHFEAVKTKTADELLEAIQWRIIESAYRGGNWLSVLHSAALGNCRNQAVLFIAPKGAGKSTLAHLLQQQGFVYLSDDIVPIDLTGQAYPIPTCQRIKAGSWKVLNLDKSKSTKIHTRLDGHVVKYVKPVTGNLKIWKKHWPIKMICYPKYDAKVTNTVIKKLKLIDSIDFLCRSGSVFGGLVDQQQLDSLVKWLKNTPSYSVTYSVIDETFAKRIHKLMK